MCPLIDSDATVTWRWHISSNIKDIDCSKGKSMMADSLARPERLQPNTFTLQPSLHEKGK